MWPVRFLVVGVFVFTAVAACSSSTPAPTATSISPPSVSPSAATGTGEESDEIHILRQLAFDYWDAFNSYDADKVLGYMEEGYRQQRQEEIRGDIGRVRRFRVKLGISEESPPRMTEPDEAEMFLKMSEPLGTRRIQMSYRRVAGEWKITFSEEVK